jgi:hypothetical protein
MMYLPSSFTYCYHSVNVISLALSQSDNIKRLPLYYYFHLFKYIYITEQETLKAIVKQIRLILDIKLI